MTSKVEQAPESRTNDIVPEQPSFSVALLFWLKLGFISFGGPAGQIAVMHDELVERRRWVTEARFLHAMNFCMVLPGPEAQQLAIYLGWMLHRTWGGIVAGVLFVLPSALILWALSWLYVLGVDHEWIGASFYGLRSAVLAIVLTALIRISRRALRTTFSWCVATLAFIGIFSLELPFPLIVAGAALSGWVGGSRYPELFGANSDHAVSGKTETLPVVSSVIGRSVRVLSLCLILWWTPVLIVGNLFGWGSTHVQQGLFFSKAAMVTFGGAYSVLPYVAQQAVERFHWVSSTQMIDGLGLAETTPGPLIMVLQFVGFLGGWHHPPLGWSQLSSATLSAALTTWVTFVPCFLWIFLGAPFIERVRYIQPLRCALLSVTSAVVGVILNLVLWFALHAMIRRVEDAFSVDWFVLSVAIASFIAMQKWRVSVVYILLTSISLGVARRFV